MVKLIQRTADKFAEVSRPLRAAPGSLDQIDLPSLTMDLGQRSKSSEGVERIAQANQAAKFCFASKAPLGVMTAIGPGTDIGPRVAMGSNLRCVVIQICCEG